jgi:hypothetical protein
MAAALQTAVYVPDQASAQLFPGLLNLLLHLLPAEVHHQQQLHCQLALLVLMLACLAGWSLIG